MCLDPNDLVTNCNIFISTYSTWYKQILKGLVRQKKLRKYIAEFTNKSKDDFKEEDKDLDKDIFITLTSKIIDLFGLIIYNKVYKLKSV